MLASRNRRVLPFDRVDELHLFVYPLALGDGQRLFGDGLSAKFTLAASEAYDNDALHVTYRPVH